jgi:hypothetical protein
MRVTDTVNTKGLEYAGDYSANFTDHSLITKKYFDDNVGGGGGGGNSTVIKHPIGDWDMDTLQNVTVDIGTPYLLSQTEKRTVTILGVHIYEDLGTTQTQDVFQKPLNYCNITTGVQAGTWSYDCNYVLTNQAILTLYRITGQEFDGAVYNATGNYPLSNRGHIVFSYTPD